MGSESIDHSASWAIHLEPLRARGIIVNYLERKPNQSLTWDFYTGQIGFWKCWFFSGGKSKPEYLEKNPLVKARTNNRLDPHMAPCQNQTRAILVEVNALPAVHSLLPGRLLTWYLAFYVIGYMLACALIGYFFLWKGSGWLIEMVQADVIVSEISCQQKFFLATFSE